MCPLQRVRQLLRAAQGEFGLCTLETLPRGSALSALKDKKDGAIRLQAEWNRVLHASAPLAQRRFYLNYSEVFYE